jgi:uncharacterized protein (TIGR03000 family)
MGMMTFGLIMIVANLSFVSSDVAHEVVAAFRRRRRPITVVFDGACNLCVRSMSVIKAIDIGDRINVVDFNRREPQAIHPLLTREACLGALQVIVRDGGRPRLLLGFWGFRAIARRLWLLWPVVPLLYIPGTGLLGPALYGIVARNRSRRIGGYTDACATHSGGVAGVENRDRAPAEMTIRLPEDAKLFVQDQLYPGMGRRRRFTSTPARFGKDYVFNVRVEIVRNGASLSMSQEVRLRAGQHSEIRFWFGEQSHGAEGESNGEQEWHRILAVDDRESCSLQQLEKYEVPS